MRTQPTVALLAALCWGSGVAAQYQSGTGPDAALPDGVQPVPGWIDLVPPGEWCGTNERYMADLAAQGLDPLSAVCPPAGPCDDPMVRDAFIPDGGTEVKTVRLSIHVFCENSGANCAASEAAVDASVAELNAHFALLGFQFVHTTEFVRSTKYRWLSSNEEFGMKRSYADTPEAMLNVYIVDTGGVSWGTFPWMSSAQSYAGGIVIDDNWIGGGPGALAVLTHEVGHCLGLWHTFHGVDEVAQCGDCYEPAGRPPELGDITGDLCSDTAPTPKHAGQCTDPAGLDPCSGQAWGPTNLLNFMGYTCRTTRDEFSMQQAGRMQCWTEDVLMGWLAPPPPPNVPGTPVLTSQGGGQVLVAWADNSNDEDGFRIERARKQKNKWVESQVTDVGADVTSILDAPGSGTFRYRVRAYNSNGDSAWSAWTQINN